LSDFEGFKKVIISIFRAYYLNHSKKKRGYSIGVTSFLLGLYRIILIIEF